TDEQVFEIRAIVLDGAHLHTRIGAAETREQVRKHITRYKRGDAEVEFSGQFGRILGKRPPGMGNVGKDLGGMAQELVTVIGDVEAARMAVEQFDAQIAL